MHANVQKYLLHNVSLNWVGSWATYLYLRIHSWSVKNFLGRPVLGIVNSRNILVLQKICQIIKIYFFLHIKNDIFSLFAVWLWEDGGIWEVLWEKSCQNPKGITIHRELSTCSVWKHFTYSLPWSGCAFSTGKHSLILNNLFPIVNH